MTVDRSYKALQPACAPCAFGGVISVVDGVREFAQPVRRPTVQDQAVAVLQKQPGNVPGDRKAPFLHEDHRSLGPLFGNRAIGMFAGDFRCAALARLTDLLGLQPLGFLVGALLGRHAQCFGEVVPRHAGGPAVLDSLQLSGDVSLIGVGVSPQCLP
ncbi:hypothetical protein [Streptomyces mirabilis]|uniref:hypothetical protein n=1 Tax=Streptomyces mirabilis TaxID=68239 RepID=UPI00368119B4